MAPVGVAAAAGAKGAAAGVALGGCWFGGAAGCCLRCVWLGMLSEVPLEVRGAGGAGEICTAGGAIAAAAPWTPGGYPAGTFSGAGAATTSPCLVVLAGLEGAVGRPGAAAARNGRFSASRDGVTRLVGRWDVEDDLLIVTAAVSLLAPEDVGTVVFGVPD